MNKEVRLSRKEQKRQKTAREQQTYERHKVASRKRSVSVTDWSFIFPDCGVPSPSELQQKIDEQISKLRDGGIEECEYARRIFDPNVKRLTQLPIGLLSQKEEALPVELLPSGPTIEDDLLKLCRRMIIRNENRDVVDLIIDGWPGGGGADEKLEQHVNDLVRLSKADGPLYRAIVCGQHGELIVALRHRRLPVGFESDSLIRMLVRHGLLWCTNDLQLILARNALAERNPLMALISSDRIKLEPTRVVNELRPQYKLLKLFLHLYAASVEEGPAQEGSTLDDELEGPIAAPLKNSIKHHASRQGIDLKALKPKLDETIPYLSLLLQRGGKRLRRELEKPPTANELEKSFHALWFSGLSNVQASAVPILRYLQAEAELEGEIRHRVPQRGDRIEVREGVALPAFSEDRLVAAWRTRAKNLLHAYRREVLQDADLPKHPDPAKRSANAGMASIQEASSFLAKRGERLIPDHQGDLQSKKRTYYLLDVIPEHRLALQNDMLKKGRNGESFVAARI